MDANEYQRRASLTAAPQNDADRAANAVLGLAGEAAELAHLLLNGGWRGSMQVQHALRAIEALGTLIEPVKKVIYQGHEPPVYADFMASFDHQRLVMRQWGDWSYREPHEDRSIWALTPAGGDLITTHREFADELGDAQWYVAQGARAIGWDLGIVMQGNLLKLERRYPDGRFTPEASQGRMAEWPRWEAVDFGGTSATVVTVHSTPPAITGLRVLYDRDGVRAAVEWDGRGHTDRYDVEVRDTDGSRVFEAISGASMRHWMRAKHPYVLRVRISRLADQHPWSDWVTIDAQPATLPVITELLVALAEDGVWAGLYWDDADWSFDYEWEDDAVYSNMLRLSDAWHLKRRWHNFKVRVRVRGSGDRPHGEWSDWAIVPARELPDVRGLRVETAHSTAPDSDTLIYARLVWENREPEIGYEVEFLETGNRYWLNESGSIAQSNVPLALRVRAAVQGREGPWSDLVTLPPAPLWDIVEPEPTKPAPPVLRLVEISAVQAPGGPYRLVSLAWDCGADDGDYVVEVSDDPAFAPAPTLTLMPTPHRCAALRIDWGSTPYIRVQTYLDVVSNVIHVPPAPPRDPAPHTIRERLNQRTVEMTWIVTRDGHNLAAAVRHKTELAAIEEAERLAKKHSQVFLVWQLVGQVEPAEAPVRWVKASDLPF